MEVDGIFYSRVYPNESFNYARMRGIIEFLDGHDEIRNCDVCRFPSHGAPGSTLNTILNSEIKKDKTDKHWMLHGEI